MSTSPRDPMTVTRLRAELYRALDTVLETGEPLRIRRKGRILLITVDEEPRLDLTSLPKRHATALEPEELAAVSWDDAWSPDS